MQLTQEQQAIINCTDDVIVVNAYAGSGKTSTVVAYTHAHPNKKYLYIAYNKSMADEAKKKVPAWVECRTLHSLAYAVYGRKYPPINGVLKLGNNRIRDLTEALKLTKEENAPARQALDVINKWFNSAELDLTEYITKHHANSSNYHILLANANILWGMMQDSSNLLVKMPHDGYLKLWHISKPTFNVDCVLLDEAQDSNDVTVAIIEAAGCKQKIIVGDHYQSIYAFRGAKNSLADFAKITPHVYYLTQSFRFGHKVANYATKILTHFRAEPKKLLGFGCDGEINLHGCTLDKLPQYTTILARTNATLFGLAIEALLDTKKVAFSGGINKYDLELLYAVADLDLGNTVKHTLIKKYKYMAELERYAAESEEMDIVFSLRLVKQYGGKWLKSLIKQLTDMDTYINANYATRIKECHYQLTTAHRAKGLEFKRVAVWDDFTRLEVMVDDGYAQQYKDGMLLPHNVVAYEQEVNLYYVAVTRAKEILYIPKYIC